MTEAVNPTDLFKEELDHDDIAIRVNAVHRLKTVVTLIGGENFKNQLLPYLEGLIKKEDDEVLYAIADELGNISNMLHGGYTILLPALETLASMEETVVRDAAVRSLQTVSSLMNDSEIQNNFIPLVLRLASGEWFTSRVSSVNLMYGIYQRAGPLKEKIRQKFIDLCNEETPMIRRAIASKIGHLATYVEKDIVLAEFIPIFKQLSSDEQDSVRVLCLDSLNLIAKILSKDENRTHALPIIIAATEDKSWRIRLALSKNFSQLAEALGKEITDISLIQIFSTLLKDGENEVRYAAVASLSNFINNISVDKIQILIPQIQTLARDNYYPVRTVICEVITNIVGLIGKETSMQKIFPLLLELVEDTVADVKIAAMKAFLKVAEVFGTDMLNPLIPHCKGLIEDKKWRVRQATFDTLHSLTLLFKNLDLHTKVIEPLLLPAFRDRAQVIRDYAVASIPALVNTFPSDWVVNSLLPKLMEGLNKDNNYLMKINSLNALRAAAQNLPGDIVNDKLLPIFLKSAKDTVPNVRFVTIKILKALTALNHPGMNQQIKQVLNELVNDSDKDVQYFAWESLQQP